TAWTGPSRPGYCLRNSLTRMAQSLMKVDSPWKFKRLVPWSSNDDPIAQDRQLGNHGDPVSNHVRDHLLGIDDSGLVDDLHVAADPGVLVDDGPFHDRAGPNADSGPAQPLVFLDLRGLLVEVATHEVRVSDRAVLTDDRPHADDRVLDDRPF